MGDFAKFTNESFNSFRAIICNELAFGMFIWNVHFWTRAFKQSEVQMVSKFDGWMHFLNVRTECFKVCSFG